ncbi:MAG: hypothetical protein WC697_01720 [Patescibacteria group bacterium]|jgi:hypothetical protein
MAKRSTGLNRHKKSHSHKTQKRLIAKRLMLEARKKIKNTNRANPSQKKQA